MLLDIEIDTSEVEEAWRDANRRFHADTFQAVKTACKEGEKQAINSRVYQDRTAQLTASIHGDYVVVTAEGAEGEISAGEDYASYVNEWEAETGSPNGTGFMDNAALTAEAVLNDEMEKAIEKLEQRANG